MTNAQIIFSEAQRLAKDGKIAYTGREFKMLLADGQEMVVKETEDIHTFAMWKSLGMQVRKGEKAVAKFTIWKHTSKGVIEMPQKDGTVELVPDKGRMFMKTAAFFSASQVEPVKERAVIA